MSFFPVPDYKFRAVTDIKPDFLRSAGISLLLLDLDNTISPYSTDVSSDSFLSWVSTMKSSGIELFMVSNNKGERPRIFSEKTGIPYIKRAKKPSRRGLFAAMDVTGYNESETALIGDQIYTDVFAAKRAGITAILVTPIVLRNPLHILRYILELPFRVLRRFNKK